MSGAKRSSSKIAPDTGAGIAQPNGAPPASKGDRPNPSSTPSPSRLGAPTSILSPNAPTSATSTSAMLSTLPAANLLPSEATPADDSKDAFDDHADNRSSSLSELGDASDDNSEPTPRPSAAADLSENDSEAETERLEKTPRKLTRTATDTSIISDNLYERTPSKLIHSKTVDQNDQDDSVPPTPSGPVGGTAISVRSKGATALESLSLVATTEAANLAEVTGKKRKRASAEASSVEEPIGEPARKRSSTARDSNLNGSEEPMVDASEQVDAEEELDAAEERISQLAREDDELGERQADIAAEAVSELATVAKHTKPRKGGGRRKRKMEESNAHNEPIASTEVPDGDGEADNDDDDSGTMDEEVSKKKSAIDELARIEKKFKIFREKLCDEQIAQYEQELEMLKQPNCTHPEYLAMIKCIDDRRAEKIAYEKQLLQYKQKNLEIITTAERHQMHSQYFQTVRDVREDIITECNQRIFELQRGRRQLGVDEVEYTMKLPEKRSDQIRHQTAYNLEVSVLSGVAKYVGFPAAPEIKPARPSEIDEDLRAMKITTRPAATVPYVRPYNRPSAVEDAAAEGEFLERTPWANPQHPAHQQAHYSMPPGPSRMPSQTYQTPAGQRRMVDIHAPNGSASTIEAHSNPPSSNIGMGLHSTSNGRGARESESPVLQMKRQPSDHPMYSEVPASHPRNFGGLPRESYTSAHVLSSPAAAHMEHQHEDARWGGGGPRPFNSGAAPSGPSIPGRPDAARVPLTQRSGLGTVSVGSGSGLFGR